MFTLAILLLMAQITPGVPFVTGKHPNPIITYVEAKDFKPVTYSEAQDASDIELLALSQSEGKRTSLEMADAGRQKFKILRREVDVTYYPVVRQTYALTDGGDFILYSYKNAKSPVPPEILNEVAFGETKKPEEGRFGLAPKPERLDVRGSPGLIFERDGEVIVFWQEDGTSHVAMGKIARKEVFRLIEDLL